MAVYSFLKTPRSNSNAPKFSSSPSLSLPSPHQNPTPSLKVKTCPNETEKTMKRGFAARTQARKMKRDPPSSPLYGPVSLDSESTDLDYTGMSSRASSPIVFAPTFNCRISKEVDFGPPPPDTPEGDAKESKTGEPARYSPIFKMGLFFSQMAQLFDRAIEGAKIKICKPKSQAP